MFTCAKVTTPATVNLLQWLTSDKYLPLQKKVMAAANPDAKRIAKEAMPCITPSGIFSKRGKHYLLRHTGFIAVDIDLKENKHIANYNDLKYELRKIPNVAYCGLSVSGTGYWLLIPIAHPDKHELHFEFIRQYFKSENIIIDKACCNVARLRFYSFDNNAYFNHTAKLLQSYYSLPNVKTKQSSHHKAFDANKKPVWEQYNESTFFIDVLINNQWKIECVKGKKIYFTRPGKKSGISAEYDSSKNVFFVFTDNSKPFESNTGYNPFQIYTILEYNGDFAKATKSLVALENKGAIQKKLSPSKSDLL